MSGPAGGCGQHDPGIESGKYFQYRIDNGGFTGAGSAGDQHDLVFNGPADRLDLIGRQGNGKLPLHPFDGLVRVDITN